MAGGPIIGNFVREEKGVSLWFLPYYAEAQRTVVTCLTLRMKLKPLGLIFKALGDLVPKLCLGTSAPRSSGPGKLAPSHDIMLFHVKQHLFKPSLYLESSSYLMLRSPHKCLPFTASLQPWSCSPQNHIRQPSPPPPEPNPACLSVLCLRKSIPRAGTVTMRRSLSPHTEWEQCCL